MSSIAMTLVIMQTMATMPVYPRTSPNFSRVTVKIGIAQNGWMRFVVESPYAYARTVVVADTPSSFAAGSRYGASMSHFEPAEGTKIFINPE